MENPNKRSASQRSPPEHQPPSKHPRSGVAESADEASYTSEALSDVFVSPPPLFSPATSGAYEHEGKPLPKKFSVIAHRVGCWVRTNRGAFSSDSGQAQFLYETIAQLGAMHPQLPSAFFQPFIKANQDIQPLLAALQTDSAFSRELQDCRGLMLEDSNDLDAIHASFARIVSHVGHRDTPSETQGVSVADRARFRVAINAVLRAWKVPLVGATHLRLLHAMRLDFERGPQINQNYSNTLTFLQSSGTGKSRACDENESFVFSIPAVLREDSNGAEYPPPDRSIRDLMLAAPLPFLPIEIAYFGRYRLMLSLLFRFATRWLQSQSWKQPKQPYAYLEKVNAWKAFLAGRRDAVYREVQIEVAEAELRLSKLELEYQESTDPLIKGGLKSQFDTAYDDWRDDESFKARGNLKALHAELRRIGPHVNVSGDDEKPGSLASSVMSEQELVAAGEAAHVAANSWLSETWPTDVEEKPVLEDLSPDSAPFIVLAYFDEAHVLTSHHGAKRKSDDRSAPVASPPPGTKTPYECLLRVLNDMLKDIFAVFLSTSSHMRQLAPPAALSSSARQAESKYLQAPMTELPFDCQVDSIAFQELRLPELSTVEFMARFGRPLFWSLMKGCDDLSDEEKESVGTYVLSLAQAKLVNAGGTPTGNWEDYTHLARIAVMDSRLCFEFEPRKSNADGTEAQLVQSHLRLVFSVPQNREYFFSGYSSEPILAEAAARAMLTWMSGSVVGTQQPWSPVATLGKLMSSGLLDRGERGELIGRYIFTRAYDCAMIAYKQRDGSGWMFSGGCPVNFFMRAMFSDDIAEKIIASKPDNIPARDARTFEQHFHDSFVRFTHFVRLGDESGLSTRGLAAAFIRGAAFICRVGQRLVDLAVPVLLDHRKPVTPENMSVILIQVKRCVRAGSPGQYDFTAEDLGLFNDSDTGPDEQPVRHRAYCTLLMELGVKSKPRAQKQKAASSSTSRAAAKSTAARSALAPSTPETPSRLEVVSAPQRRSARGVKPPVHPRFNIRAYGCSNSVYKVIKAEEKDTFKTVLLANSTWLEEHPRKVTVDCVKKMLPTWTAENAYNCVPQKPKPDVDRVDAIEEGVTVEKYAESDSDDD